MFFYSKCPGRKEKELQRLPCTIIIPSLFLPKVLFPLCTLRLTRPLHLCLVSLEVYGGGPLIEKVRVCVHTVIYVYTPTHIYFCLVDITKRFSKVIAPVYISTSSMGW
uniref:Uncharacterized protein n=1 Tax=Macaca fascicularis TaxID=9541 RepID=A0A7N9IB44_MACFA